MGETRSEEIFSEEEKMSDQDSKQPEFAEPNLPEMSPQELEKKEEEKLKAKYSVPALNGRIAGGHSAFLQKRLAKGQKYFDSGDYQMAKQKMGREAIPTPESVPVRKTSIVQPSKLTCSKTRLS
ncbi:unnamed protein product [Callosobruchus maculatus]|uniref:Alpha-endosulfine n=1 Tax=Callosobruchus maculatus TaxID=64391 RepID=A0A653CIY0_CALMS|nr:unnamed protein product [Callosobruchus maculatus]